jgi:hypothetical protein
MTTESSSLISRLTDLACSSDVGESAAWMVALLNGELFFLMRGAVLGDHATALNPDKLWQRVTENVEQTKKRLTLKPEEAARKESVLLFHETWPKLDALWNRVITAFTLALQYKGKLNQFDSVGQKMQKPDPEQETMSAIFTHTGKRGFFPIAFVDTDITKEEPIAWIEAELFPFGDFAYPQHSFYHVELSKSFETSVGNAWQAVRPTSQTDSPKSASLVWWFTCPPEKGITGSSASAAFAKAFGHLISDQKVDPRILVIASVSGPHPTQPLLPVTGIKAKVEAAVKNNIDFQKQNSLDKIGVHVSELGWSQISGRIPSCIDRIALLPQAVLGNGSTNLDEARKTLLDLRNSKDSEKSKAAHMVDLYDLEAGKSVDL